VSAFLLALFAAASCLAEPVDRQNVSVFNGETGERYTWAALFNAMEDADVLIIGESHSDAPGHALQAQMIQQAVGRWEGVRLSLEEFDRSQQQALDDYMAGRITGAELKAVRDFVDPDVRRNWMDWSLPKFEAARSGGAQLLAANAPLKYSRMVRNLGCDNLPDMPVEERAMFDCPSVAIEAEYKQRFDRRLRGVARNNKASGLKELKEEQISRMFRAHRVWDATMAATIVNARTTGDGKIIHIVGNFHSDFNGGLIQEIRVRDPEADILVLCLAPKRSERLSPGDIGRADFVVYTRS
jgi:uncharacterized iron-regulated protein